MSYSKVYSRAIKGMESPLVEVEVHLTGGLPGLAIVGLPEAAVKESKERVRSAIIHSHFEFPASKVIINLAPADLPKQGGRYDLPIAIGILIASGQISSNKTSDFELLGELALTGLCRSVPGVIPSVIAANKNNKTAIIPSVNEQEAALVEESDTLICDSLLEVCAFLNEDNKLKTASFNHEKLNDNIIFDYSDVKGQDRAKRAIEIVAAGGHHCLMVGPPGSGKSMLASRLPSILPALTSKEAVETASIYSISEQGFDVVSYKTRPFRNPHHTISSAALVGGSSVPKPGEISLSHNGVLFLDEIPEFNRSVLEVLREPLENKKITVSRAAQKVEFPAKFQLVSAMNPCPCGYLGDSKKMCTCTPQKIERYRSKLSGPFLDRIDIQIEVPRINTIDLKKQQLSSEHSEKIKQRVKNTQLIQINRQNKLNADLSNKEVEKYCKLDKESENLLHTAIEKFALSARVYHRLLKVSRTIADVSSCLNIEPNHISEALSYRFFDRKSV